MIEDGVDGLICEDNTPDALAEALLWMLQDRDRLELMGMRAIENCRLRFGKDRFVISWLDVVAPYLSCGKLGRKVAP
jgi:glycosyltransferase involved in cell wall biosynthesis